MKKSERHTLLTSLALLLVIGCKKQEQPTPSINLEPPTKASSSLKTTKHPGELEATAINPPIQLTLRIYKKQIKKGESIWYQLEIKNIGKNKILIVDPDPIFPSPWNFRLRKEKFNAGGMTLEVSGPDGKLIDTGRGGHPFSIRCMPKEDRAAFEKSTERMAAIHSEAMAHNWSEEKIYDKLHENDTPPADESFSFWLPPGISTTTAPWAEQDQCELMRGRLPRPALGGFAELPDLFMPDAEKYRIRAIYDGTIDEWMRKFLVKHNLSPDDWDILLQTPYIEFEVLP